MRIGAALELLEMEDRFVILGMVGIDIGATWNSLQGIPVYVQLTAPMTYDIGGSVHEMQPS